MYLQRRPAFTRAVSGRLFVSATRRGKREGPHPPPHSSAFAPPLQPARLWRADSHLIPRTTCSPLLLLLGFSSMSPPSGGPAAGRLQVSKFQPGQSLELDREQRARTTLLPFHHFLCLHMWELNSTSVFHEGRSISPCAVHPPHLASRFLSFYPDARLQCAAAGPG